VLLRQPAGAGSQEAAGTSCSIFPFDPAATRPGGSPFGFVDQFQERVEPHLQMMLEPLVLLLEHHLAIAEVELLGPFLGPRENPQE
jgi:hypothetical protein